ncbi:MAG: DNA gyrase subunit A, partial [Proteobacteria bacterium]
EMMLISNQGTAVRTRVEEVSLLGRNTQGVRVIRTRDGEALVSVSRIVEDDDAAEPASPVVTESTEASADDTDTIETTASESPETDNASGDGDTETQD